MKEHGKNILLIAHFCGEFNGNDNNRFNYLAALLAEAGLNVEIITSDFSHVKKERREFNDVNSEYKLTFLKEPIYRKNISLKRFISHWVLSQNLRKYLQSCQKPDCIYCSVPSLDFAFEAARFAKSEDVPFLLDVQDLWPEAFKMVFDMPLISHFIYYPMKRKADNIYKRANEIFAVSKTYAERALQVNKKIDSAHIVYLGTDIAQFDCYAESYKASKPNDEYWIAYIGTLGHSYDLYTAIKAINLLSQKKPTKKIKFLIMGDGHLRANFEAYADKWGGGEAVYNFTGRIKYCEMVGILAQCDIAVNPIRKGSAGSITNKVGDYAAAALPVVNSQECPEYRELIELYNCGFNCETGDAADMAEKLLTLLSNDDLRRVMSVNSRRFAEEKFDRSITYPTIVESIRDNIIGRKA